MLLALMTVALSGCGLFFGKKPSDTMGVSVAGPCAGLADKSLAIVIYVQPATLNEYAGVREEICAFVTREIRLNLANTRVVDPQDVIAWQNSTINWYSLSERDIARHFSVQRVLFINVLAYTTRRSEGYSNLQGHLRANCKIAEFEPGEPDAFAPSLPGGITWTGLIDAAWPADHPLLPTQSTQTDEDAIRLRTLEVFAVRLVDCFRHGPVAIGAHNGSPVPGDPI
jgi:hypothetical protein